MAITRQPTAQELGVVFATRARQESIVRELWVSEARDGVHLWLLIDPLEDDDAERALYGMSDVLDERFPEAAYQVHVFNPIDFRSDPRTSLPVSAVQIPLRAA